MKTANEWQDELAGETSVESIRAIQIDALEHATSLLTVNADSPTRGFNAICRLANKLINERSAAMPNAALCEVADKARPN